MDAPQYVQGNYSVAERDRIFAKADSYPDASGGLTYQVPTLMPDGSIAWRQQSSGGGDGTANANLAVVEPTTTASQAYSVGDLLVYGGQLYEVAAAISAGGTITPGTNVTPTTMGAYVQEQATGGGVTSFNGRTGAVTPQSGDYTAAMVGARPDTWMPSAADVGAVSSFNSRTGAVVPAAGDYTAAMVGAAPVVGRGINLLDNWYFIGGGSQQGGGQFPINQKAGYFVPSGTTYYSDTALTTSAGTTSTPMTATYVNGTYGTITVGSTTYYVAWSAAVLGYARNASYSIDRWYRNSNVTLTIESDGIVLSSASGATNTSIFEKIENHNAMWGKTYTLSILSDTGFDETTFTLPPEEPSENQNFGTISTGFGELRAQYYSTMPGSPLFAVIHTNPGSTHKFYATKLELGSEQTLARNIGTDANPQWVLNDPPPKVQQELAECQRHYQLYATQSLRPSNAADCRPVMRINPTQGTISIGGTTYYYNDANL